MKVFILLFMCTVVLTENDKSTCEFDDGRVGFCICVENCQYAINLLLNEQIPQICGFENGNVLVCCPNGSEDIKDGRKPGEISIKKCNEYYPDHEEFFHIEVWNGKPSLAKEFPHMAVLGYDGDDGIQWGCGGTIISETFILTAAHCLSSRTTGPAKYVRVGDLDLASTTDDADPQQIAVKRIIPYPDYNPPSKYHDIGLIELETPINRTPYVDIACLDVNRTHEHNYTTTTGWGKTEYAGKSSSFLMKADLEIFSQGACQKYYKSTDLSTLANGIDDDTMICAGGDSDTCQGDSGGPLFLPHEKKPAADKVFKIIGITSFGKACGIAKIPAVYTRVFNYLQWIEDVVWPE